jgi:hypothetical protein
MTQFELFQILGQTIKKWLFLMLFKKYLSSIAKNRGRTLFKNLSKSLHRTGHLVHPQYPGTRRRCTVQTAAGTLFSSLANFYFVWFPVHSLTFYFVWVPMKFTQRHTVTESKIVSPSRDENGAPQSATLVSAG